MQFLNFNECLKNTYKEKKKKKDCVKFFLGAQLTVTV